MKAIPTIAIDCDLYQIQSFYQFLDSAWIPLQRRDFANRSPVPDIRFANAVIWNCVCVINSIKNQPGIVDQKIAMKQIILLVTGIRFPKRLEN
ncbi:MAG: hypothetical protein R2778_06575 [Saprospiraceae bacterium]